MKSKLIRIGGEAWTGKSTCAELLFKQNPTTCSISCRGWAICFNPENAKAAIDGYLAYFGRYSVDEAKQVVIHHIEGCLLPNFVGTDQERSFSFEGDRLIFGDGKTWQRVFMRFR